MFDSGEQAANGEGLAGDSDAGGLAALVVDGGVVLASAAEDVGGQSVGVGVTSAAEGALGLVCLEGIEAEITVAGVALEVFDDELLVVLEVAGHVDGIGDLNWGGHGVRATESEQTTCQWSGVGSFPCNGEVGRVHDVRGGAEGRHCD